MNTILGQKLYRKKCLSLICSTFDSTYIYSNNCGHIITKQGSKNLLKLNSLDIQNYGKRFYSAKSEVKNSFENQRNNKDSESKPADLPAPALGLFPIEKDAKSFTPTGKNIKKVQEIASEKFFEGLSSSFCILGAGISGLSIAHYLARFNTSSSEIDILDSAPRPGGAIMSLTHSDGGIFEAGPHSWRGQVEGSAAGEVMQMLAIDLGLMDSICPVGNTITTSNFNPSTSSTNSSLNRYILHNGNLVSISSITHPTLFKGLIAPATRGLFKSVNWGGDSDTSVANFFSRQFGNSSGENDPLISNILSALTAGIYAAHPSTLSTRFAYPSLWASRHNSPFYNYIKNKFLSSSQESAAISRALQDPIPTCKNQLESASEAEKTLKHRVYATGLERERLAATKDLHPEYKSLIESRSAKNGIFTLKGGLQKFTDALASEFISSKSDNFNSKWKNAHLKLNSFIWDIKKLSNGKVEVTYIPNAPTNFSREEILMGISNNSIEKPIKKEYDHVVSALPSQVLASVLKSSHPNLASSIYNLTDSCPPKTVASINLYYDSRPSLFPRGFGYLIPAAETNPFGILGCIFDSDAFPINSPNNGEDGDLSLTVMAGGYHLEDKYSSKNTFDIFSESNAVALAHEAVMLHTGVDLPQPKYAHVQYNREAIPTYAPIVMEEALEGIHNNLRSIFDGSLTVVGKSYGVFGVGLPKCIENSLAVAVALSSGRKMTGLEGRYIAF